MARFNIFVTHKDGTKEYLHAEDFEDAKAIAAATGGSSYEIEDGFSGQTVSFEGEGED